MSPSPPASAFDLLIVGAGFAGLYILHKARRQGLSARVIEAAPSVGGTWYHNRYPGARVDIQSMEYSFSFDEALQQDWHWSER
ncbi:MAG: NAD(P)-binding protein, partial [Rubrivivax sp.]